MGFAFGKIDSSFESLEGIEFDLADDNNRIAFGNFMLWVSQLLSQFAIVGQQDQTGARGIESSDGEETMLVRHEIDHAWSALRIAIGTEHAFGFVECKVDRPMLFEFFSIDTDGCSCKVDFDTDLRDDLAIDLDAALFDQFIDLPARAESGSGKDFIDPLQFRLWFFLRCLLGPSFSR